MKQEALQGQNSDDSRHRILRAAASLFAHKGYAATSTREIIEAAGVTKPTLYYNFKSKEVLYLTILGEAVKIFHDRLTLSVAPCADMRTCLRSLFSSIESLVRNHPDVVQLLNAFLFGPPSEVPCCKLYEGSRFAEVVVGDILRRGVEEGEILENDLQSILLLIMGLLQHVQRIPADSGLLPNEAIINRYVSALDLIFRGSLKRNSGM